MKTTRNVSLMNQSNNNNVKRGGKELTIFHTASMFTQFQLTMARAPVRSLALQLHHYSMWNGLSRYILWCPFMDQYVISMCYLHLHFLIEWYLSTIAWKKKKREWNNLRDQKEDRRCVVWIWWCSKLWFLRIRINVCSC